MSVAHDHSGHHDDRGPYTVADLDALPEEGKGYELVHGWVIPLSPSIIHDEAAEALKDLLRPRIPQGYVLRGPWDVQTPDGSIYLPDVAIVDAEAVRAGKRADQRAPSRT